MSGGGWGSPFGDGQGPVYPPMRRAAVSTPRSSPNPDSAISGMAFGVPFDTVERDGVRYVGTPWRAVGALILDGRAGLAGYSDSVAVQNAQLGGVQITATSDGLGTWQNVDIVSFDCPDASLAVAEHVFIWLDSEIAWRLCQFNCVVGGSSQTAAKQQVSGGFASVSGKQDRALNLSMNRPVDRNGRIPIWTPFNASETFRLQATNFSRESAHYIEVEVRGRLWPQGLIQGRT